MARLRRRVGRRVEDTVEVKLARISAELETLDRYVKDQLGENGEMETGLVGLFCLLVATISDIRDAAILGSALAHSSENSKAAIESFFDVVIECCDITEKRQLLTQAFPNSLGEIDTYLRRQDGTRIG